MGEGLITFKDLLTYCKPEAAAELFEMVENKEVSAHTEPMGKINYRYPYYSVKVKAPETSKSSMLLGLIDGSPGLNAVTIRETLGIGQSSFERWEEELLENGRITRVKSGKSWLYYCSEAEKTNSQNMNTLKTWLLYRKGCQGLSIQKVAEKVGISREGVTGARRWLEEQGILVGDEIVGYWAMTKEERQVWLRKSFGRTVVEQYIKERETHESYDEFLDSYLFTPNGRRKEGVVQTKPLAQPDELGQLILEILGKGKMTTAEIAQLIPGAETPGPLREEVRLKVLSMMDSDLLNRDWWPQVEDNPARFSRKIRV